MIGAFRHCKCLCIIFSSALIFLFLQFPPILGSVIVSKRDWAVNPNPYHLGGYACVKVNAYSLFSLPINICNQYLEETLLLNESRDLKCVRLNLIIFKQQCRFSRVEIYWKLTNHYIIIWKLIDPTEEKNNFKQG